MTDKIAMNELSKAFDKYNASRSYDKQLDWHTDICDNINDKTDIEEINAMCDRLRKM